MKWIGTLLLFFLFALPQLLAQVQVITIDLSKEKEDDFHVQPGVRIIFQIINKLPNSTYKAAGEVRSVKIPELESSGFAASDSTDCSTWVSSIKTAIEDLKAATTEEKIPAIVKELQKLQTPPSGCTDTSFINQWKDSISAAIASTRGELEYSRILESGTELHLIVSRTEPDNKSWERVFTTGPLGEWLAHYGLMALWKSDDEYAVRGNDSTGLFIRRVDRDEGWDCVTGVPVVIWHYMPANGWHKDFTWSAVGGIGWYDDNPFVLVGVGAKYKANVGIALAALIRPKRVLNGRYVENQQIQEFLDDDQLTEWKARLGVGLALTLRLGSNPFKNQKVEVAGSDESDKDSESDK